jgi:ketosteroid isomerase-like protein
MSALAPNAQPVLDALISLADAFNSHDLDRIMNHFADDAVLEMPRGKDSWGTRFVGKAAVREGLAGRWTVTGTSPAGKKIRANGCDFYTFRAGLVVKKDCIGRLSRIEIEVLGLANLRRALR